MTKPTPPKDLSPEARQLWRRLYDASEMDPPGLLLLNTVCEQWDRMMQAREMLRRDGIMLAETTAVPGVVKHRIHPAHQIERDATGAMLRAWHLMGWDTVPPGVK